MIHFNPQAFRQQFPLFNNNNVVDSLQPPIVYFDNGATTQKPECVIQSYMHFYQEMNANVHRGSHQLSTKATVAFEKARTLVKDHINAKSNKEIIWTKGTTESINLIAASLGRKILNNGDEIILAVSEHHANIVPWQLIAEQTGAVIKTIQLEATGKIDLSHLENLLTKRTKFVCCAHISNVIGKINPLTKIIAKAKTFGAITVIDGAQATAHFSVDVQTLDCDFYVFSAHKMYGPTGVGVLYGKQALLESMPPYQAGGEMISKVSFQDKTTFNELPFKFEAGTPNIAGVIAFGAAITFFNQYQHAEISKYEQQLTQYCYQALSQIPQVTFIVKECPDIPVMSFSVSEHHNHDIATSLDSFGIAVRSGHHCAMPLMEYFSISGCIRVTLAAYNTFDEIDYFIKTLKSLIQSDGISNTTTVHSATNVITKENTEENTEEDKAKDREACTDTRINKINEGISGNKADNRSDNQTNTDNELTSEAIIEKFSTIKGWDSRHREIMLLGKQLKRLEKKYRNDISLINGCESLAWLVATHDSSSRLTFQADSDAKIIRGLLVIVLSAFNHKTPVEIASFDIQSYFEQLGLIQHLSPSRGNGVLAIVQKIKALAQKKTSV